MNYCTHKWGLRLKRRLAKVEIWAEKQGLELAADCHLARITQTAHLLQARKGTPEDIATLSSTCFKLNSLQLKELLSRYTPAENEAPISGELIDTIVRVAENTVDELTRGEGRQVRLEEDFVLQLPFLLPEDNYSCDIVRGVPGGLSEFLAPLQNAGLCVMTPQPSSSGHWTIYMDTAPPMTPVPRSPSEMSQITVNGGGEFSEGGGGNFNGHNGYPGHHNGPQQQQSGGHPMMVPPSSNRNSQVIGHNGYPVPVSGQQTGGGFMGPNGPMMPSNGPIQNGPLGNGPSFHHAPTASRASPKNLPEEPEIHSIRLSKTNGMGLSIVAAKGVGQDRLGIYIKAVVEGGAAWQDGRLAAGDQLLTVDGQSLVGITQERAAEIMMRTGSVVTLEVARQGAIYHGLATLLSQPSPVMSRGGGGANGPPRHRESARDLRQTPVNGFPPQQQPPPGGRMPQSKSTPALHQSPGGDSQHNYQNQEWLHQQLPSTYRHPPTNNPSHQTATRSASIQNLVGGGNIKPAASGPPPTVNTEPDPGYYQNLMPPPAVNRQQRFGSQTSLTGPPPVRDRPISAHYPSQQRTQLPAMSPISPGPEKPQRQFAYEAENPREFGQMPLRADNSTGSRTELNSKQSHTRVRFQDNSQVSDSKCIRLHNVPLLLFICIRLNIEYLFWIQDLLVILGGA